MEGGVDHLAPERNKSEFDVDAMKIVWAGSSHVLEVSERMARLVASDPVFRKDNRSMLGRKELFKNTLRKATYAWKRIIELRLNEEEASMLRSFVDEPAFTDLHWGMFIPAIKGQGTEEQQRKWLPLAQKMQIIGCYAQTELGHGSNVQGLETTATFDPKTDEFVIHSPTLTSSKWWPGGLGKVSTHAIVYARLITDGHDHGVNGFIVQLRSLDDHLPLPGITVGDIGMKFGNGAYNTMDNGVLRFDNVRIPRDQMLMRWMGEGNVELKRQICDKTSIKESDSVFCTHFQLQSQCAYQFTSIDSVDDCLHFELTRVSQVTREGKLVQSNVPRQLVYGTMVYVRQTIVADASVALSRAVCIATRYSAVRRQFGSHNGGPETQVIDYKTQQARLFPLIASAYAFRFVGEWLKWLYMDVMQRLQASDFSTLPEAHACTAGLKSLTTSATADGIEECRKLCGGHGYLCSSGLPELFAVYVPTCTYEGDNVVLQLQVARHLMKTISQLGSGKKPIGTTAYIGRLEQLMQYRSDVQKAEDWLKPDVVLGAFESRAARKSVAVAQNLSKFSNPEEGFQELSADLAEAAVAHCQLIVVSKVVHCTRLPPSGVWGGWMYAALPSQSNRVARHLMKTISQLGSGKKPIGTTAYIGRLEQLMQYRSDVQKAEDWLKPDVVLGAFESRAARKSVAVAQNLSKFSNPEEGFQELSADLAEAAVAHCQLIVVSKFIEKLQKDIPGKGVKKQLERLCSIYALFLLHKHLGDFLSTGCITPKQGYLANEQLRSLYSQVRPNAIALVDAFNHTDHYLGSVLGRYDGNVYQMLYDEAWKDPLNDSVVPDGYQEHIRPMLKQQLRNARL
ncbi:hypothetical protein TanjilG_21075 [Lupinus angustifolius]|uniref:acyl-CoA oxidase n=1 Tax=Lupinus angustifolius TaxID=3871 RepID=A0A1J7GUT4_LUPAN|nr:hypothetical protein TanjilG_21075 [Lupinus angustifolius]